MSRSHAVRLFIALELPSSLRFELASWARTAVSSGADSARIRLLEAESMHLTVCFLGSRPIGEIDQLCSVVERCALPVGECSLGAPLWLPPRRPRALAVEVHEDSGMLSELHARLVAEVSFQGIPADGASGVSSKGDHRARTRARPLRPHITVARLGAARAPHERALPPTPQSSFSPERLTLYRSHLGPEGASYEALASAATAPVAIGG